MVCKVVKSEDIQTEIAPVASKNSHTDHSSGGFDIGKGIPGGGTTSGSECVTIILSTRL